jgi:hypothetical protein
LSFIFCRVRKCAQRLVFHCNCIGPIDVVHPIPQDAAAGPQAAVARPSGAAMAEDSGEDTDVDAYLNTAMFATRVVRIF